MPDTEEPRRLRYEVVKDLVLTIIDESNLKPGDRLPSSAELAVLSGVSQISVRRALDELEQAGRIERHQGVGTFVSQPRIVSTPARSGDLLETLEHSGDSADLVTELRSLRVGMPGAPVAKALRLQNGQPVWEVVRRRLMLDRPVLVERAILPVHRVPALDETMLADGGSLYRYLEEAYGLVDAFEEQYLEVTMPTHDVRGLLDLPARELVVIVKGVSFSNDGEPFDCFEQVYPARQFAFYVSGTQDRRLLSAPGGEDWTVTSLGG
ncbi:MAG: GntR family transcriptional regulator [Actinobacteria bacterium]|nr:GntR family transcriptional regulator [Actinomycetota bacterium]